MAEIIEHPELYEQRWRDRVAEDLSLITGLSSEVTRNLIPQLRGRCDAEVRAVAINWGVLGNRLDQLMNYWSYADED